MKTTRGRKPTDVTLRNIRATRKQVAALQELIKALIIRVRALEIIAGA